MKFHIVLAQLKMRAIQIFQAVLLVSSALAQIDDDKIVGGQDATQGQFPYQVSVIRLQKEAILELNTCR